MKRVHFSLLRAAKWRPEYEGIVRAFLGRNWWYWRPHFQWNKGIPWRSEVVDIGIAWFDRALLLTIYPKWIVSTYGQANASLQVKNEESDP